MSLQVDNYYNLIDIANNFEGLINENEAPIYQFQRLNEQNVLDLLLESNKKLPDLSFYDIKDGFHMELRMYSLDHVFFEKKSNAQTLINELTKFVLYTENLMVNVISILNLAYDYREFSKINPKHKELVDRNLLWGDYHTKAQQKKIFKNLFGKDEVDRATHRNTKSLSVSMSLKGSNKKGKSKRKTKKVSRNNLNHFNRINSSEEVKAAYKDYLSTMPRNNNN
jgi:hypothetical protein